MSVYKGKVSGFVPRTESGVFRRRITLVWDFRLERCGLDGRPLPRLAAEMRGKYFRGGSISDGDMLELTGSQRRNGLVVVNRVRNLTAGTVIRARSYDVSVFLAYLAVLLLFTAIVYAIFVGVPASLHVVRR
jgi:hypothetical protein